MDIVLLERIDKLGGMGDVVGVRPGYARNFLIPQGKALRATKANIARFEAERAQREARNASRRTAAESLAGGMEGAHVALIRQAADNLQLYGSVKARDIADGLAALGFEIDRRAVVLPRPIKTLGLHRVVARPHPEVEVTVVANVARSEEEARLQENTGRVAGRAGDEDETEGEVPLEGPAGDDAGAAGAQAGQAAGDEAARDPATLAVWEPGAPQPRLP